LHKKGCCDKTLIYFISWSWLGSKSNVISYNNHAIGRNKRKLMIFCEKGWISKFWVPSPFASPWRAVHKNPELWIQSRHGEIIFRLAEFARIRKKKKILV